MARFSFGGIQVRWDSYSADLIFGEIHFRRDSVLAGIVFIGIHFGGISTGGLWNGGILSYSRTFIRFFRVCCYVLLQRI